jgi:hypothetical protein
MITFALSMGDEKNSKETAALRVACLNYPDNYTIKYYRKAIDVPKQDTIPAGSIPWVESCLGKPVKPDYYPEWTKSLWGRNIWTTNDWPTKKDIFIKPADKHKRFKARITTGTYKGKKKGPFICSEKVSFGSDEWRHYVANGKILATCWYSEAEQEIISECPLDTTLTLIAYLPADYCGAVDTGTIGGRSALVECNSPYSCGWYGSLTNGIIYAEWLIAGWKYINNISGCISTVF